MAVLPDAVQMLRDYLAGRVGGARVSTVASTNPTFPYVTLQLVAGQVVRRRWLDRAVVDVNVWAATPESAADVFALARSALQDLENFRHSVGVVAAVDELNTATLHDEARTPPIYRHVVTVAAITHP